MANENPSRDTSSRQQSAERAQTGSTASQQSAERAQTGSTASQQGAGSARTGSQGSSYGQGSSMQGSAGQGSHGGGSQGAYEQGGSGQSSYGRQGTSTWQGGREGHGGALTRRGGWSSMSPYGSEYESGYGSGPFSIMRRISDEMDRFFENFGMGRSLMSGGESGQWGGQGSSGRNTPSMWSPHVEVSERGGKLLIQADLPGMKREDINVQVEHDAIVIQGERRAHQTSDQGGYYRSERSYGSFYRTIPLPEGTNGDSAQASFRDGVLEIELDAPREQQRGRRLDIRDGGSHSGSPGSSSQGGQAGTGTGATYGGTQHAASGAAGSQHTASGSSGSQQSSGSGTMYSGSGNPSAGAAGMGSPEGSSGSRQR